MFVGAVWLAMVGVALGSIGLYGHNAPLSEDWTLVPSLTGNEPNLASWLWAQHQEHRLPLSKLALLGVLKLTGGDFRAGMVLNVVTLAALALAMVLVARKVRGGLTRCSDAFFPLALLHLGNWDNLLWGWQFQFVLSTVVAGVILMVLAGRTARIRPVTAAIGGFCLVLLPLTGANGLVLVPLLAAGAVWEGLRLLRHARGSSRTTALLLLSCGLASVALSGVYFIGYERPAWNPASPGPGATLETSAKVLALGFGPAASASWTLAALVVAGVIGSSLLLVSAAAIRGPQPNRGHAVGLMLFQLSTLMLALALGWGRAGSDTPVPMRYVLLGVPALIAGYYIWVSYGPRRIAYWVQLALFSSLVVLLPMNVDRGLDWRDWYVDGMTSFERDVASGLSVPVLAERHRSFLMHWSEPALAADMEMLRDTGTGALGRALRAAPLMTAGSPAPLPGMAPVVTPPEPPPPAEVSQGDAPIAP